MPDHRSSVGFAFQKFIDHKTAAGVSPATVKTYNGRLRIFRRWLASNSLTLHDLTHELMDEWVLSLRNQDSRYSDSRSSRPTTSGALSAHTIAGRIRATKTFLTFCHQRQYIPTNPGTQLRQGKLNHHAKSKQITRSDMYKMFDIANQTWQRHGHPRNLAILFFAADTGCRRGELTTLTLPNLDLDNCEATVNGKTGVRAVDYTETTAALLRHWLAHRATLAPNTNRVWVNTNPQKPKHNGRPLTGEGIYQMFKRTAQLAGVNGRYNPQAWRHHLGNTLAARRENSRTIMDKLGHTSIHTTVAYYIEPQRDHIKDATRRHAPTNGYALTTGEND